jgi:hypothetical protein
MSINQKDCFSFFSSLTIDTFKLISTQNPTKKRKLAKNPTLKNKKSKKIHSLPNYTPLQQNPIIIPDDQAP